MARKFLSGVLAFAMTFSCAMPVMAMAEATVPTETVEDQVEQQSLYYVDWATTATIKLATSSVVKIPITSNISSSAATWSASAVTASGTGAAGDVTVSFDGSNIVVKANKDLTAGHTYTFSPIITFTTPSDVSGITLNYTTGSSITPNAYMGAPIVVTASTTNTGTVALTVAGDNNTSTDAIDMTAGKTADIKLVYTNASGTAVKPASVKVDITTAGKDYVSAETVESSGKTVVTLKALKSTTSLTAGAVKVKITYKGASDGAEETAQYVINVSPESYTAAAISVTPKTKTINYGKSTNIVAQAKRVDDYGTSLVNWDGAAIDWYINGTKLNFNSGAATFGSYLTITKVGGVDGLLNVAVANNNLAAGTYAIKAVAVNGGVSDEMQLTVKGAVAEKFYMAADDTLVTSTVKYLNSNSAKAQIIALPGSTTDISTLRYTLSLAQDSNSLFVNPELAKTTTKYTSGLTYAVTTGVASTASDSNEIVLPNASTYVSVDTNGVVTVKDDAAGYLTTLLTANPTKVYVVGVTVTPKDTNVTGQTTTVKIGISKASATVKTVSLKQDGTTVTLDDNYFGTGYMGNAILKLGKDSTFVATMSDSNGFTTGISQKVIWSIDNVDVTNDKNVYATVNSDTGVVTPLMVSTGKCKLTGVPVAAPNMKMELTLYISAADATPTPTATATSTPTPTPTATATATATATPTATPTTAPVTKTGEVTASSLNVRKGPGTSYDKVTKITKGAKVTILGEADGWYNIKLADGTTGYVSAEYIKVITDTPVVGDTAVTTANLRMRKTASTSATIVTVIPKGTTVDVLEKGASWSKVQYGTKTGYVSNTYLTFTDGAVG